MTQRGPHRQASRAEKLTQTFGLALAVPVRFWNPRDWKFTRACQPYTLNPENLALGALIFNPYVPLEGLGVLQPTDGVIAAARKAHADVLVWLTGRGTVAGRIHITEPKVVEFVTAFEGGGRGGVGGLAGLSQHVESA